MKSVLACLVLVTGSLSMAATGQLFIDGRVDHKSYSPNDAVGNSGYEAFQITRLKIDYQGTVGDKNAFRVRLDTAALNTTDPVKQSRENSSKAIDIAYISHKFTDEVSLAMGKIVTGMGGYEGSVVSPGDIYLRTVAGDELAAIYYPTGVQAELTFGDHKLKVNMGNNTTDVTNTASPNGTAATLNNTRSLVGATYSGKLMDANLLLNASYHMEDYQLSGNGTKKKNSFMAAGGKYIMGDVEFEADYLSNKYDFDPQAAANVLSTISVYGLVRYKMTDLGAVLAKYESSEQKTATSATADSKNKITGLTAAFEYKPVKDENWRMHLAFTQKDNKPETGDTKTEKIVYAGMRFYGDFLK